MNAIDFHRRRTVCADPCPGASAARHRKGAPTGAARGRLFRLDPARRAKKLKEAGGKTAPQCGGRS